MKHSQFHHSFDSNQSKSIYTLTLSHSLSLSLLFHRQSLVLTLVPQTPPEAIFTRKGLEAEAEWQQQEEEVRRRLLSLV